MQYVNWNPTIPLQSPVYLDANILVGTTINGHPLYNSCIQLIGTLLVDKANILISPIAVDECMWATAKLAYCKLINKPDNTKWTKIIYRAYCDQIFKSYGPLITAVSTMIKDWKTAGVPINLVPSDLVFDDVLNLAPKYMSQYKFTPADALHLAIAEKQAKTLVTADSDFNKLQKNLPPGNLVVVQLPKT
jgi:predicted nucleic acid-binding protein